MKEYVVDTNVPIVANGRSMGGEATEVSVDCRVAAIKFLQNILKSGRVIVDVSGEIEGEYRRYLNARGQPGVGDRFYQEILVSSVRKIRRIDLQRRPDGEYVDLPQPLIDDGFDRSDRKFAAAANKTGAPVVNAVDSDWLIHKRTLDLVGVSVKNLCGCDRSRWFLNNN